MEDSRIRAGVPLWKNILPKMCRKPSKIKENRGFTRL